MPAVRRTIDLTVDSKVTSGFRRRARIVGVSLLGCACVAIAVRVGVLAGRGGLAPSLVSGLALLLILYATLALYLSDVRNGNLAAVRGMIAGGLPMSVWMGLGCAWTTDRFDAWLGLLGVSAGLLGGGATGMVAGVLLGWAERSALAILPKRAEPIPRVRGDLRDRWIDPA